MKVDVYETVTNQVIAMMEQHGSNWVNPFAKRGVNAVPHNLVSKKAYRGINSLLLGWSPYSSPTWATYKQWAEKGCQVRKGEKATGIVFWQFIEKVDDKGQKQRIPFLRHYAVFNADQVDGYEAPTVTLKDETEVVAAAEDFFRAIPADVRFHDAGKAYYSPLSDKVCVPHRHIFEATPTSTATEAYYSTLAHELAHWTGHHSRLDRIKTASFGTWEYAREELVAELASAFLCATLGISASPRADHAQYLNAWIGRLKDHKREFVSAASAAAKAADFLTAFSQPDQVAEAA